MKFYEDIKFIKRFNKLARFSLIGNLQRKNNYIANRWSTSTLDELYEEYFYDKLNSCLFHLVNNINYDFPNKTLCRELVGTIDKDNLLIAFEIVYKNTKNLRKRYGFK